MFKRIPWIGKRLPSGKRRQQRSSVAQSVMGILLLASLIPLIVVGVLSFYRSRALLQTQVNGQMQTIAQSNVDQLHQVLDEREQFVDRMMNDGAFKANMVALGSAQPNSDEYNKAASQANLQLKFYFDYRIYQFTFLSGLEEVFLLKPDGQVLIESTDQSTARIFGANKITDPQILGLVGNDSTQIRYLYPVSRNDMTYLITRAVKDSHGATVAEMILYGNQSLITAALKDINTFYPQSGAFFYTNDAHFYGLTPRVKSSDALSITTMPVEVNFSATLVDTVKGNHLQTFNAVNNKNQSALVSARWIPEYSLGIAYQIPEETAYAQNTLLDPYNLGALMISLLITSLLIYFSITRLISPLATLAEMTEKFSKGNWAARANIRRNDEIGQLANAFNRMAEELSDLYHSLETVVEKRTSQLRAASEVAQLATSASNVTETLSRTVQLISERFGYYHVALYLVDETGHSLAINEAGGKESESIKQRDERIDILNTNLMGWVVNSNKARVLNNIHQDQVFRHDDVLPETLAQVVLPVSIGADVLGALTIQSTVADVFDAETVSVLQTLANQISSTLRSNRLLETTQVSYQETSLLYRATRQVSQAQNEEEVTQILVDSFIQLPYVTLILDVQGDQFKVSTVTDSKTGRIDRNLTNITISTAGMAESFLQNRLQVIDIGKPSIFDNILSFLFRRGCKTAALLPVIQDGQLTKVIALGAREADSLSINNLQPYANLVEVVSTTLEKFNVFHALQNQVTRLSILTNFAEAISSLTETDAIFDALLKQVQQVMGEDVEFAVAIYDNKTANIEIPYRFEQGQRMEAIPAFPLGEGLTSHVLMNRKGLLLADNAQKQAEQLGGKLIGDPPKSWLGVPLISGNETIGALIVQDTTREHRFGEQDLDMFMALAPEIASAIRNAELLQESQASLKAYTLEHFLLNSLLEYSPESISFKSPDGKYIRASQSMADFYQLNLTEIAGKTDAELLNDTAVAERIWHAQRVALENKQPITQIYEEITHDQTSWWQVSLIPVYEQEGDETPYCLLSMSRDITPIKNEQSLSQRRAEQLLTASEIARDTSGTLDVNALLKKSVNLVRDRFGFYHSSIFLIDAANEFAVLRESTGDAGEQMVRAGHRLAIGSKSVIGRVTTSGQALIVNDVTQQENYFANPLLPETRSELGIPLIAGERLLGVLDVQSRQKDAFNQEDINVLRILADQLAVALINADLFAKTQELLGKHRLLRQITMVASAATSIEDALVNVVKGLREVRLGERVLILLRNAQNVYQAQASAGYENLDNTETEPGEGIIGLAIAEKHTIRIEDVRSDARYVMLDPDVRSELAIPILFGDEVMGVLNLESTQLAAFDENDLEILGALGNNLGGVIANIRLVQQVRQQVDRERMLFEATSKIRRSVDMNTILQTSTQEICQALGARRARIHITAGGNFSAPPETADSGAPVQLLHPDQIPQNGNGKANGNANGKNNGNSHKPNHPLGQEK